MLLPCWSSLVLLWQHGRALVEMGRPGCCYVLMPAGAGGWDAVRVRGGAVQSTREVARREATAGGALLCQRGGRGIGSRTEGGAAAAQLVFCRGDLQLRGT